MRYRLKVLLVLLGVFAWILLIGGVEAGFCGYATYHQSRCMEFNNLLGAVDWCKNIYGECSIYSNCDCVGEIAGYSGISPEIVQCRYDEYRSGGRDVNTIDDFYSTVKGKYNPQSTSGGGLDSIVNNYDWCGFASDSCVLGELRESHNFVDDCGILTQEQCLSKSFFQGAAYNYDSLGSTDIPHTRYYPKCSVWNPSTIFQSGNNFITKPAFCSTTIQQNQLIDPHDSTGRYLKTYTETPLENDLYKGADIDVKSTLTISANPLDSNKADLTCEIDVTSDCFYDLSNFHIVAGIFKKSASEFSVPYESEIHDASAFVGDPEPVFNDGGSYQSPSHLIIKRTVDANEGEYYCGLDINSPVKPTGWYSNLISPSVYKHADLYFTNYASNPFWLENYNSVSGININENEKLYFSYPSSSALTCSFSDANQAWPNARDRLNFNIYVENSLGDKIIDFGNFVCTRAGSCSSGSSVEARNTLFSYIDSEAYDGNGFRCVAASSEGFFSKTPVVYPTRGNLKNPEFYGAINLNTEQEAKKKTIVIMPSDPTKDWREILQANAASVWNKGNLHNLYRVSCDEVNERETDLCKEMYKDIEWCNEISEGKCAYPFVPVHAEDDAILWNEPPDNEGSISLSSYADDIKPERIVCINIDDTNDRCQKVFNLLPPEIEKVKYNRNWQKEAWKDMSLVVLVDYNDYKAGLVGTQIASIMGAPIFFVGEDNIASLEDDLHGKLMIVVGDISCTDCLNTLKERNKVLKYNTVNKQIELPLVNTEGVEEDVLTTFASLDEADTFIDKFIPAQGTTDYRTIVINPSDIKPEYCETLNIGGVDYDSMYCGMSVLAPYIASATDAKIEFVETAGPAHGVKEAIVAETAYNRALDNLNLDNLDFTQVDTAYNNLKEIDNDNNEIVKDISQSIKEDIMPVPGQKVLLLAENKAIPYGRRNLLGINDGTLLDTSDYVYCDLDQNGFYNDELRKDCLVSRLSKRSASSVAIAANFKIFNDDNVCYYDNRICPVKTYTGGEI